MDDMALPGQAAAFRVISLESDIRVISLKWALGQYGMPILPFPVFPLPLGGQAAARFPLGGQAAVRWFDR